MPRSERFGRAFAASYAFARLDAAGAITGCPPIDTGRDHAPGNLAGAITFLAWRAGYGPEDCDRADVREIIAGRTATIPHAPECAFCGEPAADDEYHEEGYPAAPCCSDEDACYERKQARDALRCVKCGDPIEPENECERDYPQCFPCQGAPTP